MEDALLPGQQVTNRPDLTTRVFQIKLRARMAYIIDDWVFGKVEGHVRSIEIQKRSLRHTLWIFLGQSSKLALPQPDAFESIIIAETSTSNNQ